MTEYVFATVFFRNIKFNSMWFYKILKVLRIHFFLVHVTKYYNFFFHATCSNSYPLLFILYKTNFAERDYDSQDTNWLWLKVKPENRIEVANCHWSKSLRKWEKKMDQISPCGFKNHFRLSNKTLISCGHAPGFLRKILYVLIPIT